MFDEIELYSVIILQDDPNQNLLIQLAIALKICIVNKQLKIIMNGRDTSQTHFGFPNNGSKLQCLFSEQ